MDNNKLKVLRDVNYKMYDTCNTCRFSMFENKNSDWGLCRLHIYYHLKHCKNNNLSINRYGYCDSFVKSQTAKNIGFFREFL